MRKKFWDKSLFSLKDELGSLNLFKLAIPHFLDLFFISSLSLISTIIISRISDSGVIGVDAANRILNIIIVITNLINIGSTILISIYMGRGDKETVSKLIFINFVFTLIVNLTLCLIVFAFSKQLLHLLNAKGEEFYTALTYLRVRVFFLFVSSLTTCIVSMLRCFGDNKPTLICGVVTNIISTAINILSLTEYNPFPTPLLCISFAPVIATVVGLLLAIVFWIRKKITITFKLDFKLLKHMLKVGIPGGISNLSYTLSQVITTAFALSLANPITGDNPFNTAKIYLTQILYMVYYFGYALGNANAIMVGRKCGAGDLETADKMHRQNTVIAVCCNIVLFFLVFSLKDVIFKIFSPSKDVMKIISTVMLVDFFVEIGRAFNHMGEFGLNAVGDVYATTAISISACWGISVLLAYVFGIALGGKLIGIWIAFAIDECLRGSLYFFRWRSGRWKKKFIEHKI